MDKNNEIVDFQKKKEEILFEEITDYSDIAELVIDACYSDGIFDCELAKDLLFQSKVVDDKEEIRDLVMTLTIDAIEKKGFPREAYKLREMLSAHINRVIERYHDPDTFFDCLQKDEKKRIEAVVENLFKDEINFSGMTEEEVYQIMKDAAKYSFYYGSHNMLELVLYNKKHEISLTFMEYIPMVGTSKNAFAYLVNLFDEVSVTKNSTSKTITVHFSFYNLK